MFQSRATLPSSDVHRVIAGHAADNARLLEHFRENELSLTQGLLSVYHSSDEVKEKFWIITEDN